MAFKRILPVNIDVAGAGAAPKIIKAMRDMAAGVVSDAGKYPTAQTSYRRTGDLGRGWGFDGPGHKGKDIVVRFGNDRDYWVWVQGPSEGSGPKQRQQFKELGWTSITDITDKRIDEFVDRFVEIVQG